MAKGGNDGWIAAKPAKKGVKVEEKVTSKLPRLVSNTATVKASGDTSPQAKHQAKSTDKKKKSKPVNNKQPFTIKDDNIARMSGAGTGVAACMNCLNFLTTEFTAPERIPTYDNEKPNFPASKLSAKVTDRINAVLDTLSSKSDMNSFLKVLVNNMISTSRQAENAWGARVMGQLFMKKYPEMAIVTSDLIQNETHPGAVMSVLWMFSQVKEFKQLMSMLFWLVLPKLKQKKVAEFLPKLLSDIESAIKKEKDLVFSQNHIEQLIRCMDDSKLQKPITIGNKTATNILTSFFVSIRDQIRPTHIWIERFLPLLSACNRQYALPLILASIESAPEKATQELIRLSTQYRLQVDQVVEACPSTTLNDKLRSLITAELTAPMATSAEIKKRRKNAKKSSSSPSKAVEKSVTSSSSTSSSQNGSFLGSLTKLLFYAILTIGCMSQIEATRPTYDAYAGPYVEQYVEPVYSTYVVPKYNEFVAPHVDQHVVPNYNKFVKPHIVKGITLWNDKVQPVLSEKLILVKSKYAELVEPHLIKALNAAKPVLVQVQKDGLVLIETVKAKAATFTKGWEGKVEDFITEARAYVAVAGIETRRMIDLGTDKGADLVAQVKNYDYGTIVDQVKDKTGGLVGQVTSKTADLTVVLGDKVGVYYEQAMEATAEHRAVASEKLDLVVSELLTKGNQVYTVVHEKAVEYEVATYFEQTFEFVGRSIIWVGDAVAELAGGRFCCFKSRMRKLAANTQQVGNDIYAKFITV